MNEARYKCMSHASTKSFSSIMQVSNVPQSKCGMHGMCTDYYQQGQKRGAWRSILNVKWMKKKLI